MSLQWVAIAGFLYFEMGLTMLLMLPFVSATRWQKIFNSGIVKSLGVYGNYYFTIFLFLLGVLFADSVREARKYSHSDQAEVSLANNPNTVDHVHMKLFRAERNLYITGFTLFLWFVIRRLITLISTEAKLSADKEAALKQAKSATDAAQRFMNEPEKPDESSSNDKNEAEELKSKLSEARDELKAKDADLAAIKKQAESTNREYDRLSSEFQKLQQQVESSEDKKTS